MAETTPTSRKIEIGVLVTLALAVIGFAFWLGGLDAQVKKLDPVKIDDAHAKAGSVPRGTIIAWAKESGPIPAGWAICNGDPGTPDLRDRFLYGAGSISDAGAAPNTWSNKTGALRQEDFTTSDIVGRPDNQKSVASSSHAHDLHLPPHYRVVFLIKR
jgi:hypothetical protein